MNPIERLFELAQENNEAKRAQDAMRPRFETMAQRHTNGTAPRGVSAYQLFQTPACVAAEMAEVIKIWAHGRVLEPSAGLGRLVDAVKVYNPREVVAVECAPALAAELYRSNRPGVTLKQKDFLKLTVGDIGFFDAIIMNPPFHMRADIQHIEHARKFLRQDGRLVALCMDTEHRRKAFQGIAKTWRVLPPGTFRESGADVGTIMFSL